MKNNRLIQLARSGEVIFHARDLANLWQMANENTLYTTLKRYIARGLLFRIYKGFFSLKPIDELDPQLLGIRALHEFAYISTETVLIKAGIMQQDINKITLISSKSKKFSIGNYYYSSRQLADQYLHQTTGIIKKDNIKIATVDRAIADMLYFNPNQHFDGEKLINWRNIQKMQKKIGYPLTPQRYDFT